MHSVAWPPSEARASGVRGLLLIVGFWTVYGAVMTANLLLSSSPDPTPPTSLLAFTYFGAYVWAVLTLPVFWLASRIVRRYERPVARYVRLVAAGLVVAALVTATIAVFSSFFLRELRAGTLTGSQGIWGIARFRYMNDLLACLLILTAGVARDYLLKSNALRVQLVEARLETLRNQLNPHFLFNTLNTVSGLVATDPPAVRRIIELLSGILRHTLDSAPQQEVRLGQELETLGRYLEIFDIRFAGRLQTAIHAPEETTDAFVPNFVLQPLVENALNHGVAPAGGRGRVDVEARIEGEELVLRVTDSRADSYEWSPLAEPPRQNGGYGLHHTRERLRQLYGPRSRLRLVRESTGTTVAEVRLPHHTSPWRPPLIGGSVTGNPSHD